MKHLFIIFSLVSLLMLGGCTSKGEVVYALESPEVKENGPGGSLKDRPGNAETDLTDAGIGYGLSDGTREEAAVSYPEPRPVYIAVLGEVNNPGIYVVEAGTRVFEVINEAGGTTGLADLTRMDLVAVLTEDCTLKIPGIDSAGSRALDGIATDPSGGSLNPSGSASGPVKLLININTAGREELMTLKGIGATRADAIIEYRNANGPFAETEDLMNVSGIGEATYGKLKDSITAD